MTQPLLLDASDDNLALLETLGEPAKSYFTKWASERPAEDALKDKDFALVLLGHRPDGDPYKVRKFACDDASSTALSTVYLLHNQEQLPEAAAKSAAKVLMEKSASFGITPPPALCKLAEGAEDGLYMSMESAVRKPRVKVAEAQGAEIRSKDDLERASDYFMVHADVLSPWERRAFAQHMVKSAAAIGETPAHLFEKYAGDGFAPDLGVHIMARMAFSDETLGLEKSAAPRYRDLYGARLELGPEEFARRLEEIDKVAGLPSNMLDHVYVTFDKVAAPNVDPPIFEDGNVQVTAKQVENFVSRSAHTLERQFGVRFREQIEDSPVTVFKSLPRDHKIIIARLISQTSPTDRAESVRE